MVGLFIAVLFPANLAVLTIPPELMIVPPEPPKEWTQEMVKEFASSTAVKYGLNKRKFLLTMECENHFNAKGQSQHPQSQKIPSWYVMQGDPKKEQSFGSVMINLPSHKDVSREEAESPEFAIPWMANQWLLGNASMWTCWRNL